MLEDYQRLEKELSYESGKNRRDGIKRDMAELAKKYNQLSLKAKELENNMDTKHTKDAMDMLKLMGWTTDSCGKVYTKGESTEDAKSEAEKEKEKEDDRRERELYERILKNRGNYKSNLISVVERLAREKGMKDGGPGSGVKGHTTQEPSYTSRSGYNFEEPKVIEAAIKKVKESGHPDVHYLSGLEMALERAKKERGMKDDDATEMGTFEELGQNHETEAMEPEEHPTLAQDAMSKDSTISEVLNPLKESWSRIKELSTGDGDIILPQHEAKDEKFEVIYSTGKWPNEVKTYKEIFNAPYEEAKKMAESKKRGDYYRLVQVTKVKDSDPKVAEAMKIINLSGGAM